MNNKFLHTRTGLAVLASMVAMSLLITACKKTDVPTIPPSQSTFLNKTSGLYLVTSPDIVDSIQVGVTSVANTDRTISFSVTSPTGAVAGTHYTLVTSSVKIPAGKAIGYLVIKSVFAAYDGTARRDTLVIKLTGDKGAAITPSDFSNTFSVLITAPCKVVLSDYMGDYANTNEVWFSPYGPYTTHITAVSQLTATTGTITVANIFDNHWNPIKFKLDWSDPLNTTVTLNEQSGIADGGTISSSYAGEDVSVNAFPGVVGTFSSCDQTFTLVMEIGYTGLGYYTKVYTVHMAR